MAAAAQSPWISETTTPRFETDVIRASIDRPVVVDFWAPWCGPCRQLTPILEKLATELNGRFQLVKINIDENPEIAQAFAVQSIPYVVALRDQQVVSEFMGVHPEDKLREWLNSILPSKAEELLAKGKALEASDPKGALAAYREAATLDSGNDAIKIALARVLLKLNLDDESRKLLADLEARGYLEPEAEKIKSQLELRAAAAEAGPLDEARKAAAAAPNDLHLQLKLAEALAVANRHEEALKILLEIIQKDKTGVGVEAKNTMVRIFDTLGAGSDLVGTYRRKLATALY
ncbi:MAG TPA: thioredoxin [Planctomycetaceae bacterium]|jgi:putative thioredoxin|nr:thioredoxin [Planctomycetaceae bacterium]